MFIRTPWYIRIMSSYKNMCKKVEIDPSKVFPCQIWYCVIDTVENDITILQSKQENIYSECKNSQSSNPYHTSNWFPTLKSNYKGQVPLLLIQQVMIQSSQAHSSSWLLYYDMWSVVFYLNIPHKQSLALGIIS